LRLVVAFGDFPAALEEVAFEEAVHEVEGHDLVRHAEKGAVMGGEGKLAGIVLRAVVEAEPGHDFVLAGGGVEGGDRVHPAADEDHDLHSASAGSSSPGSGKAAVAVRRIPPRGEKRPFTIMRRGAQAPESSSRMRLT